jgi:hypothetical protein
MGRWKTQETAGTQNESNEDGFVEGKNRRKRRLEFRSSSE